MSNTEEQPQLDGVERMTDADLRRLSREPGNAVFSALPEEEREPWPMEKVAQVFRAIHADFIAHCGAKADGDVERRRELFRSAGDDGQACIRAHPTLFEKVTTREIATDPRAMAIFWGMIQLHHKVETGDMTMDTARQVFAAHVSPAGAKNTPRQE
tara:strand:+ start:1127 stop:1594 length:468 start_codon:yes stop_codon:yes gene_type:complete